MAEDVTSLGIKIDTRQILTADKALDRLAKTAVKVTKATDGLTTSAARATAGISSEGVAATRTARATDGLTTSSARATTATHSLNNAAKSLLVTFSSFAGILGAIKLKNFADEFISLQNRIKQVTEGTAELNKVTIELFELSKKTRTEIGATATLFQRLTIASEELGLSQREILRITETINKSFAVSGATAIETAGAIRQLSQGLAAGALRGDEFNSVAEQAPIIMRAIAKETRLTIGELREFAATGGITAEIVVNALQGLEDEIDIAFAKSIATFSQKIGLIENDFIQWAGSSDDLADALDIAAEALRLFAIGLQNTIELTGDFADLFGDIAEEVGATEKSFSGMNSLIVEFNDLHDPVITGIGNILKIFTMLSEAIERKAAPGFSLLSTALRGAAEFVLEFTDANDELLQKLRTTRENAGTLAEQIASVGEKYDMARDSIDSVVAEMIEQNKLNNKLEKSTKNVTEEIEDQAAATQKLARAQAALRKTADGVIADLREQVKELRSTEREWALYTILLDKTIDSTSLLADEIKTEIDILFDLKDSLADAATASKDLDRAQKRAARQTIKEWTKTRDFMAGVFVSLFDNGKNAFEDLFIAFKTMIKMMIATAAANQILLSIGFPGAPGGTAGSLAGSAVSGAVSGAAGGAAAGGALGFLAGGAQIATLGDAITVFGPAVAALAGALKGFDQAGLKGGIAGAAGGFGGAIGGAELGFALAGPIGAAVGTVLGGFIGGSLGASVFGGKFETRDFGLNLAVAAGDLVAESFEFQRKKGGLFGSDKKRTLFTALGETNEAVAGFLEQSLFSIQSKIIDSYAVLGVSLGENVFDSFSIAAERISTKGKTDEEISAAVQDFFGRAANEMSKFANSVALPFEDLIAISQQFAALTETRSPFEILGDNLTDAFDAINQELPETFQGFIDLVTSLDKTTESGLAATAALLGLAEPVEALFAERDRLQREELARSIKFFTAIADETLRQRDRALTFFTSIFANLAEAAQRWTDFSDIISESTRDATDSALKDLKRFTSERQRIVKSQLSEDLAATKEEFAIRKRLTQDSINDLQALSRSLAGAAPGLTRGAAQGQIGAALTSARAGDFGPAGDLGGALDAIAQPSEGLFGNFIDYQRDFAKTAAEIKELTELTDSELTLQERTLAAIETREQAVIDTLNLNAEMEIQALDNIVLEFETLIDVERGIAEGVTSLAGAINALSAAIRIEADVRARISFSQTGDLTDLFRTPGAEPSNPVNKIFAPGFANGTDNFGGGFRVVGGGGPELERTGSSKIMSNADLMKALGGNKETAKEVRELKNVIKAIAFRNVPNLQDIADTMDDWNNRGLPAERTA